MIEEITGAAQSVFGSGEGVFEVYDVELTFPQSITGGVPKNAKAIEGWVRSGAGVEAREEIEQMTLRTLQENGLEIPSDATWDQIVKASEEVAMDKQGQGFKRDDGGLYVESRQVDAMLKESTNILFAGQSFGARAKGHPKGYYKGKSPKSYVAENVFARPHRIHLGCEEPDGVAMNLVHVGNRSSFSYSEYVTSPVLQFQIEITCGSLSEAQIEAVFLHAERNGLGARRSQGEGKFAVTRWERVA